MAQQGAASVTKYQIQIWTSAPRSHPRCPPSSTPSTPLPARPPSTPASCPLDLLRLSQHTQTQTRPIRTKKKGGAPAGMLAATHTALGPNAPPKRTMQAHGHKYGAYPAVEKLSSTEGHPFCSRNRAKQRPRAPPRRRHLDPSNTPAPDGCTSQWACTANQHRRRRARCAEA